MKKSNLNSQSQPNKFISKKKSLNKLKKLISLLNIRNSNQKFLKKSMNLLNNSLKQRSQLKN